MMNYDEMTVDELEFRLAELAAERADLKVEAMKVHAALDRLNTNASAARKLATLSDAEKRALVQMIQAEGAASGESVGAATL